MSRRDTGDLIAFLAVARERSFTRAAASLGVSPSALSHTMRGLEERLGLQLLTRTTRNVSPTEAGERLLHTVAPHFDGIDEALAALTELRDRPAGKLRLAAGDHAAETILWPAVEKLRRNYPDITVEIDVDNGLTDIVAGRYHAGVRLGERVDKDMIAVRISPDQRMAVVGAPSYFAQHPKPRLPKDLTAHACINLPADVRRLLCVGVREARKGDEGAGRRAPCLQLIKAGPGGSRCRVRLGLLVGGPRQAAPQERRADPGARRLVPAIFWILPLLPEPPATKPRVHAVG